MKTYYFPEGVQDGMRVSMGLYSHDEEAHLHDYIELVYILSGSGIHYVDNVPFHLNQGCMLYVDLGQVHRSVLIDNMSYVNFKIKPEYFSDDLKGRRTMKDVFTLPVFCRTEIGRVAQLNEKDCKTAEQLIFRMIDEQLRQRPGFETIIHNNMVNLLILMQRNFTDSVPASFLEIPKKLKAPLNYIDEHCGEKITVEDVCGICHYSSVYFYKMLKQYCGCGFSEYLMKKRVNKAMGYLLSTDIPIHEIAELTGFSNKTHFYKTFKKFIGEQPSFIRKYVQDCEKMVQSMLEEKNK